MKTLDLDKSQLAAAKEELGIVIDKYDGIQAKLDNGVNEFSDNIAGHAEGTKDFVETVEANESGEKEEI